MRKSIAVLALAIAAVTSHAAQPSQPIREFLGTYLKDPDSAKFGEFSEPVTRGDSQQVCGLINGRNGYGGYAGFRMFSFLLRDGKVIDAQEMDSGLLAAAYGRSIADCLNFKH
jgi:hypothetical protein